MSRNLTSRRRPNWFSVPALLVALVVGVEWIALNVGPVYDGGDTIHYGLPWAYRRIL